MPKTYGQYCGLARALDRIGDRWTLLIVRELLVGPRRYSQIRAALPGIATNLLAQRLRDLAADDIVRRDGSEGLYELTPFGRGLEGAVHELIRWGGRWMVERGAEDEFRPEWLVVALAALIPRRRGGRIEIHTEGSVLHINRGRVGLGEMDDPDAVIEAPAEAVLGIAADELPLSSVTIRGSRAAVATALGRAADVSRR